MEKKKKLKTSPKTDYYRPRKEKRKQVFPFVVLKPTQGSGFSRSVPQQRKKRDFRTQSLTAATSPRLTGHG